MRKLTPTLDSQLRVGKGHTESEIVSKPKRERERDRQRGHKMAEKER